MLSTKRSRGDDADDSRAHCPFDAKIVYSNDKGPKPPNRLRTDDTEKGKKWSDKKQRQLSPFAPTGKFKGHETMGVNYAVEPARKWIEMTRYNSFVLNGIKYSSAGFVFIANESSVERKKGIESKHPVATPGCGMEEDWVAKILKIRAADEHHVYAGAMRQGLH